MRTRLRPILSPMTPNVNSRPAKTSVYELIAHSSSGLAGVDAALGRRAGDRLQCDVEHGVVDDDGEQAHDHDAEDDPSPALNRLSIHEPLQGLGSVTRDRSK